MFYLDKILLHALVIFGEDRNCRAYHPHVVYFSFTPDRQQMSYLRITHECGL